MIPGDKQKHIIVGAIIAVLVYGLSTVLWPAQQWLHVSLAMGITTVIGFGFELFSYITRMGHAEWMDGVATVAGGVAGVCAGGVVHAIISLF